MKAENLLNWGAISRLLTNSRQGVRKNKIPNIHKPFVSELLELMDAKLIQRLEKPSGEGKNKDTSNAENDSAPAGH